MATADEKPETPRRHFDPIDLLGNLILATLGMVILLLSLVLVAFYGFAGLAMGGGAGLKMGDGIALIGGIIGLIGGIVLGAVVVAAVIVGVCGGALALLWLFFYIFLIDQDIRAQAAATPEGNEPPSGPFMIMWPPAPYRAALIIAVTAVLWANYGLPALLRMKTWPEFRDTFLAAAIVPLGFVGMVARHWLAALGEWLVRHPRLDRYPRLRRALLGARGADVRIRSGSRRPSKGPRS